MKKYSVVVVGVGLVGSRILQVLRERNFPVSNVRVLAMGQTVETKNGEAVVTGATATLELDPHQAELVLLAQRTGTLALELRPLVDAQPKEDAAAQSELNDNAMTIVRFGVTTSLRPR